MQWLSRLIWKFSFQPKIARLQKLLPEAKIYPTGSRYICSPPRLFTDIDFLVYTEDKVEKRLLEAGFRVPTYTRYNKPNWDETFSTWRKGMINLIVTGNRPHAIRHLAATHCCKLRNDRRKINRVMIHEAFRGQYFPNVYPELFQGDLKALLDNINNGAYGDAVAAAYCAKHGIALP